MHALARALVDQIGVEVPGVDHHVPGARVVDQHADLIVVGFRLSEGVVEHDVDGV